MIGEFIVNRDEEYQRAVMSLHTLYLEKFEKLNPDEREAFTKYLTHLGDPFLTGIDGVTALYSDQDLEIIRKGNMEES